MSTRSQIRAVRGSRRRSELRAISTPGKAFALPPVDTEVDIDVPVAIAVRPQTTDASPRYRVLGSIHRGGMGEILLAKVEGPEGFSRKVVLKGLLSRLSEDDVSYRLFMREARLMARLDHPNIVRVFDLPCIEARPYLAMEYLRGRNFHQVIQRAAVRTGGVPLRIALAIVSQALRGLHYAHATKDDSGTPLGIIHRDVSPGNLLVSFFGEVKVTDFGIAKLADSPRYTGPRSIRGKARYVAPEQVHGENATVLSDIYSAGVVLAEALLGEPLWERSSIPETLLAIVSEDREAVIERILDGCKEAPGLRAALRGSLALNPADRFDSALQFAEVLEAVAENLGPSVGTIELGLYIRDLFREAPDVPQDDGFGRSGFPIPKFRVQAPILDEGTDSTVIHLEADWLRDAAFGPTTRMRPEAPRTIPPPLPVTPVPRDTSATPSEPMAGDSLVDDADTLIKGSEPIAHAAPIRAAALSDDSAIVHDPAEPLRELSFVEQLGRATEPESAEPAFRPAPPAPRVESELSNQRSMALLLGGIFIGAGLAISGCVVALLMGT